LRFSLGRQATVRKAAGQALTDIAMGTMTQKKDGRQDFTPCFASLTAGAKLCSLLAPRCYRNRNDKLTVLLDKCGNKAADA
jgi:hypothetical protein